MTTSPVNIYNICLKDWHTESGKYDILVGASSADIRLRAEYQISYLEDYTIIKPITRLQMQES